MSTYKRKSSQGRHNVSGQRQEHVYPQVQHSGVSEVGHPFPNKPVYHRRTATPRTEEDSFDLHDFEKITITKQPRGLFLPREHDLNDIRKTTESQHPKKDSNRPSSGELQMAEARAIHAKKLMVQDKLRRVEEITRQKIQRDSVEAAAGNDVMMSEEDFKLIRRERDQRNEDRMRNAHEEEGARWRRRETGAAEYPQSKITGNEGTLKDTVYKKKVSGELNKLKWKNVTEYTRGKRDEKRQCMNGKTHARQEQDGLGKAKEREQNKTSIEKSVWPRQKEYMDKMYKDMHCSDDEQDIPRTSQEELAQKLAIENPRGAQCRISGGESTLPLVFGGSNTPQEEELGNMDSPNTSIQLVTCTICNRKFNSDRLEKHVQICKKVNQTPRQVFNSYVNRTKGSAIEQYWKTHSRSKTPELFQKKSTRQNHKANTTRRLPAGPTL